MAWACRTVTEVEDEPRGQLWSSQGPSSQALEELVITDSSSLSFPVSRQESWKFLPCFRTTGTFSGSSHTSLSHLECSLSLHLHKSPRTQPTPCGFQLTLCSRHWEKEYTNPLTHMPYIHSCPYAHYTNMSTCTYGLYTYMYSCLHIHMTFSRCTYYYYILCSSHIIFSFYSHFLLVRLNYTMEQICMADLCMLRLVGAFSKIFTRFYSCVDLTYFLKRE